jgi:hypothetical protein
MQLSFPCSILLIVGVNEKTKLPCLDKRHGFLFQFPHFRLINKSINGEVGPMNFTKLMTLVVCLLVSTSIYAKTAPAKISEVFVDTDNNQLVISGSGFDTPDVSLGEYPDFLNLDSSTGDYELVVDLPLNIPDGDYKLTISQITRTYVDPKGYAITTSKDDWDLTIGAVGPEGPQGDKGDTGLQGDQGDTGADGADATHAV